MPTERPQNDNKGCVCVCVLEYHAHAFPGVKTAGVCTVCSYMFMSVMPFEM